MVYKNYLRHLVNKTISKKNRRLANYNLNRLFKNADQIHSNYGLTTINELLYE